MLPQNNVQLAAVTVFCVDRTHLHCVACVCNRICQSVKFKLGESMTFIAKGKHMSCLTCMRQPRPQESTAQGGPCCMAPHSHFAISEGLYCAPTIHEALMRGKSPVAICSVMRSSPCKRQSSVSVTTTALMHMLAWICSKTLRSD